MVSRFRREVPGERATRDGRKQEHCFRVLILFGEIVTPNEKPKVKGKIWNRASIVLDLGDRSTSCDRTIDREMTSEQALLSASQK